MSSNSKCVFVPSDFSLPLLDQMIKIFKQLEPRDVFGALLPASDVCEREHATSLPSVRRRSECVSLGHVNQIEQRTSDTRDGRNRVCTLLKRHRAGGDFVQ